MKKQFTLLLVLIVTLWGVISIENTEAIDRAPVINSLKIDTGNWHYYPWDPAPQEIYPGTYLRVEGENFKSPDSSYPNIYTPKSNLYLDGIKNTDAGIEEFVYLCTFWLSSDIEPGQHYVEIENTHTGLKSEKFYFEVFENCDEDKWWCGEWGSCSIEGKRTRTCEKVFDCHSANTPSPKTEEPCKPLCIQDEWSCSNWSECSIGGKRARECKMIYDCPLIDTSFPLTVESCNTPSCTKDTWQCGSWGACSPQGIQTRSCNKTYDCPSAETASPATSQYCESPNKPDQTPSDDLGIVNQDSIIKASVKLICPVSSTMASQGSGTVISSDGTILTNKHVVDGTVGCLVGFINNYNDEPYFNDRQIADIYSISSDSDIAILKLRNSHSRNLTAINIAGNNSNNLSLGDQITTYGYPAKFGTKITYTSGDFSGVHGDYLKTTAVIEYGNSGGGAYLKNGTFIGIPTAVMKGELNSLGYILSVNKINSWLNNSPIAYNYNSNNNYSRVSILEDIDLNTLSSLSLFIADENEEVVDGDIIQCQNSSNPSAVYIVKIIGGTKYIRHIVSLDIFNYYKHLKWESLKQVNFLDDYSLSGWVRYNTGLNGTAGPIDKVYEINSDQSKHWINMTAEQFLSHGGSEPAIFNINQGELNLYTTGADVMSL